MTFVKSRSFWEFPREFDALGSAETALKPYKVLVSAHRSAYLRAYKYTPTA